MPHRVAVALVVGISFGVMWGAAGCDEGGTGGGGAASGGSGGAAAGGSGGGTPVCDGSPLAPDELISLVTAAYCERYLDCCPNGFVYGGGNPPLVATKESCSMAISGYFGGLLGAHPEADWKAESAGQCCVDIQSLLDAAAGACDGRTTLGRHQPSQACANRLDPQKYGGEGDSCASAPCNGYGLFCDPADSICKGWKKEGDACTDGEECAFGDCAQGVCGNGPKYSDLCAN